MHPFRKLSAVILSVATASVLLCAAAVAQGPTELSADTQATNAPPPPSAQKAASPSEDGVWHFDVAPYVFVPGIHGTVGVLGHDASVHVSGSDVLSNFNGGFAGFVQARKNRFILPIDFIWARTGTTQGIPLTDLGQSSIRFLETQTIFTPKVGYRIVDKEHFKVDALIGLRYWHEGLTVTPRPANINYYGSANWVDGIAGGNFEFDFSPKVWIIAGGDAGGGGANLDYQAVGTFHVQPKPLFGFFVGWRYLVTNYTGSKGFLFDTTQTGPVVGLNFQFGGRPPVPPTASCSVAPTEIWSGDPVTATMSTQNFNPKHTLTYAWTASGGKISGTSTTGNVDTTGLTPGSYTVKGTATDEKEKKNNVASCEASFTVKQPHPPVADCSASPNTVKAAEASTLTVNASSPDNFPLTYAWSASAGHVNGTGASVSLDTTGAPEGAAITATATVTDSRGLSTSCSATVNVLSPPVTVSEVSEIGECKFMDAKRPARVDNTCKAILDDVALRIQHEPNGKFVVVGFTDEQETVTASQLGAQRSVNMKYYLVNGEGGQQIDATRIDVRTSGTMKEKGAKIYFVPSGTTFTQESVAVDETQVKGQGRNSPAPKKKARKTTTQASPAQ
jgi:hypothetical protein